MTGGKNLGCTANSEAVFGSAARGDFDRFSDRDILIVDDDVHILRARTQSLEAKGWSVAAYTFRKLRALATKRVLFIQHLKLEANIVCDKAGKLDRLLRSFQPKLSYKEELLQNGKLANLASRVPDVQRGQLYAADVLYVAVRNFGIMLLAESGIYAFSYDSVINTLEDECLIQTGAAKKLLPLRAMKSAYRSKSDLTARSVHTEINDALLALPRQYFPSVVEVVPPNEVVDAEMCWDDKCKYIALRDIEKRLMAFEKLCPEKIIDSRLVLLTKWTQNPRIYASLFDSNLKWIMKEFGAGSRHCAPA